MCVEGEQVVEAATGGSTLSGRDCGVLIDDADGGIENSLEDGRGSVWDWLDRGGLRVDFDDVGVWRLLWWDDEDFDVEDWWGWGDVWRLGRSSCCDECRDELEEWCERLSWWVWWLERLRERERDRERSKEKYIMFTFK